MRIETFAMERLQSTWENVVDCDLSESGTQPPTLAELVDWGLDMNVLLATKLGYSQSNGTIPLRELIAAQYPGATADNVTVANGTSEANYVAMGAVLADAPAPARCAVQLPNYMQAVGLGRYWGKDNVDGFHMRFDASSVQTHGSWRLDWTEVEKAIRPGTAVVYITNPNNPTGAVMTEDEMRRLAARCDEAGAWLIADEVYRGTEIDRARTPTFFGMGERVIVTSGLSKAYGLPGTRIGWVVASKEIAAECWRLRDYITICPSPLSDAIARFALRPDVQERMFRRSADIAREQFPMVAAFAESTNGLFTFRQPAATAMAFMQYSGKDAGAFCQRLLKDHSVLIVDGALLECPGYVRVWAGAPKERMHEGLRRMKAAVDAA